MKQKKQWIAVLLVIAMLLMVTGSAFAAVDDTGFADVAADAWYAGSVAYVQEQGLMGGTGATTFAPNTNTSRAMLATILYRISGSEATSSSAMSFTDVPADAWYASAVNWAAANGIVSGYGNGLFGSNDPVSREQIAAILWRYEGRPDAAAGQSFADEADIAAYAAEAVDWARANGIVNGKTGNLFDPQGHATRAEVAAMLRNYMTMGQSSASAPIAPTTSDREENRTLVVYFSMPETTNPNNMNQDEEQSTVVINGEVLGNTQYMAQVIAEATNADVFRIEPTTAYPTDHDTLVALAAEEQADNARPAIRGSIENWEAYDTVFVGYPKLEYGFNCVLSA